MGVVTEQDDPVRRAYEEGYRVGRLRGRLDAETEAVRLLCLIIRHHGGSVRLTRSERATAPAMEILNTSEDGVTGELVYSVSP